MGLVDSTTSLTAVVAALHNKHDMNRLILLVKCVLCAVSACTFVLLSYQQSVKSHALRTRNGLHYVLICLQQILPTHTVIVWDHRLYATYLRRTNNWQENRETYCKYYYSVQLTSLNKRGRSTNSLHDKLRTPAFTLIKYFSPSFKERGNVLLCSTKRGRGTDRILLRQQFLGSLKISNLRR